MDRIRTITSLKNRTFFEKYNCIYICNSLKKLDVTNTNLIIYDMEQYSEPDIKTLKQFRLDYKINIVLFSKLFIKEHITYITNGDFIGYITEDDFKLGIKEIYSLIQSGVKFISSIVLMNIVPLGDKSKLSPKEREIVDLILDSKNNSEIAIELYISESTIKTHTRSIYKKLRVKSRKELLNIFL